MTDYPTPWVATQHTMVAGRWYAGVIQRQHDKFRRNSKRCSHKHKRPDLALKCAEKMLEAERLLTVGCSFCGSSSGEPCWPPECHPHWLRVQFANRVLPPTASEAHNA